MKVLWVDDIRNPMDSQWRNTILVTLKNENSITKCFWVKNYNEFTSWILENGLPDHIFFDHDLADDSKEEKEKTGLSCAKWLIDYCIDNKQLLPKYSCHSSNPAGRDNILGILNNYKELAK